MKPVIAFSAFVVASAVTLNAFGQGTCNNSGGGYPGGTYDQGYPYGNGGYPSQQPPATYPTTGHLGANGLPQSTLPVRPAAKITVVPAEGPIASTGPQRPTAKLTVVADDATISAKQSAIQLADAGPEAIDAKLVELVGTWKAVARRNGGELTTVELRLDDRGWAELTVPGNDGKPSTTKRRVTLDGVELKLAAENDVLSLGKLVDFNRRQMVLERTEGQLTFVRI